MASNRVDDYLFKAVDSILQQSYRNIELIFVANGDKSKEISAYISQNFNDVRLQVIETPIGQLSYSLNLAISYASGDYIARMDADDISLRERIAKQLSYLQINDLDMVGSDINLINSSGEFIGSRRYPKGTNKINKNLFFRNTFSHNTILIKKTLIMNARGYNAGFNSEDYDLWLRLKRYNVKWDNIDECLLDYRIHDESTQRKRLGYAESAGYCLREVLLQFSFIGVFSVIFQIIKVYVRSKKI